jgi:threonine aldolase
MRQAGILAAAGLHALRHNLPRLADDHRRARELAARIDALAGASAPVPETNIVMVGLEAGAPDADAVLPRLVARGVWMTAFGARRLRAVTHLDLAPDAVDRAAAALAEALGGGA